MTKQFYQVDTLGDLDDENDLEGIWDSVKNYAAAHDDVVSLITSGPVGYAVNLAVKNNVQTPAQKAKDVGLYDEVKGAVSDGFNLVKSGASSAFGGSISAKNTTTTAVSKPATPAPAPRSATMTYAGAAALAGAAVAYYKGSPRAALAIGALGAALVAWPHLFYPGAAAK